MQASSLLQSINVVDRFNEQDFLVKGISYHSKEVKENHVFVCITGYKTDGHKYLQDAVNNGAKAAIVEKIDTDIHIPQYRVPNSRIALAQLSAQFYGQPSNKMQMIGITATNGKTTTSFMTNSILDNHGFKTGLIGTINVKIENEYTPSFLTTPESLELQQFFKDMSEVGTTHTIMEVSSAAQEMHRVETVDFDVVTLNNINREHIDTHGSFENYVETKTRLIKNASKHSIAILNLDCVYSKDLMQKTLAKPITFSVEQEKGDLCAKNLDLSSGRAKINRKKRNAINV